MSTTALTPATMVRNSYVTFSPTAFTSTVNGEIYTYNQLVDDKFFIYVDMTSSTNTSFVTFTVSAGSTVVAWMKDLGTLAVTLTSTGVAAGTYYRALLGPLDSAQFGGSTGKITITATSSLPTGLVGVIGIAKMPYVVYS